MEMCPSNASFRKPKPTKSSEGCENCGDVGGIRLIHSTGGDLRYILMAK